MTIEEIKQGQNKFCGPAVISAITGITTDEAERVINKVRGYKLDSPVTSIYPSELRAAFEMLGYKTYGIPKSKGRSIYFLMLNFSSNGVYLFYVPNHVIAIEIDGNKRWLIDNHTKKPLTLGSSARLGQRVDAVVKVEKV